MDTFEVIKGHQLYQWDTGRSLAVRVCCGEKISEVHFAHADDNIALRVPAVEVALGILTADIPNRLLQRDGTLKVWAVVHTADGRQTLRNAYLSVRARAKPDDYVYTETEIMDYRKVAEDLAAVAEDLQTAKAELKEDVAAVAAIADGKLDKRQPVADAGKLLYVSPDGAVMPLALGEGLEIVDGVLRVTATGSVIAQITVDDEGNAVITGASLTVDDSGNGVITGAALTVDENGNAVLG